MNQGKYVFAQLTAFLPARVFDRFVAKYCGNKWAKHFTCHHQLLCMMFGQLSGRDSLRDLLVTLTAHQGKYYHLGLGKNVSRTNLARANERRDYRIYEEFAYELIALARSRITGHLEVSTAIEGNVYAFDSTTVDLCLSVFWWASFRKTKAAIKVHTLLDVRTSIPVFLHITEGNVHDLNALDALRYESGGFYVVDKAYVDFKRLYTLHEARAFFVTRAKENLVFRRLSSQNPDKKTGIRCDQRIRISGLRSRDYYPEPVRRIRYFDAELGRAFVFLTNNFELPAQDIAQLYKQRWKIELFFKWIKQHLRINSFWGTSINAVKTQVYIAVSTYVLVAFVKHELKLARSTYEILQILSASLFDKTPLHVLLNQKICKNVKEQNIEQLKLSLF
ncbi:MAG: IS4 family transposase [Chitinophagaceae bacterium]|nr:MAG: IS4 family transposase [Chitinophagaceae bacterium]